MQRSLDIARGIAKALRHAHEHHVLHCDIKPANVLIADAANQLVAAEVLPGDVFAAGEKTVLFSTMGFVTSFNDPGYAVAIDDQRFLMIRVRGGGGPNELIVVENWIEELKAKVGK